MNNTEFVVLVDPYGNNLVSRDGTVQTIEKLEAHRRGLLHRAVSVFVFNGKNELLLQKRALEKYHSPGKWANTCCTHPRPNENPMDAAIRRLFEEMGLNCGFSEAFTFSYQADVGIGLIENEFDHIFFGFSDHNPQPDPSEVADWRWMELSAIVRDFSHSPQDYTVWFRYLLPKVIEFISRI